MANDSVNKRFAGTCGKNAPLLLTVTVPQGTRLDSDPYRSQRGRAGRTHLPHWRGHFAEQHCKEKELT